MDKKKNGQVQSLRFLAVWAATNAFAWAVIFIMGEEMVSSPDDFLMYGFIGAMLGLITGGLQSVLMERLLYRQVDHWWLFTVIGTTVGWLTFPLFRSLGIYSWWTSPYILLLPIFITPALVQWVILRRHIRSATLWVLATGVSSMIFTSPIINMTGVTDVMILVFAAILQGIVLGFTILWLFQRLPANDELSHEEAVLV